MLLLAHHPAPSCRWTSAAGPRRACLAGCPVASLARSARAAIQPLPLELELLLSMPVLLLKLVLMLERPVRPWPRAPGRRRDGSLSEAPPL